MSRPKVAVWALLTVLWTLLMVHEVGLGLAGASLGEDHGGLLVAFGVPVGMLFFLEVFSVLGIANGLRD